MMTTNCFVTSYEIRGFNFELGEGAVEMNRVQKKVNGGRDEHKKIF